MKLLVLIVLFFIGSVKAQEIIDWQAEGLVWANNCEFVGNDIYTVNVSFEDCRFRACRDQSGCTHFNYVSQAGVGTCTMKKGPVTLKDAKFKNTLQSLQLLPVEFTAEVRKKPTLLIQLKAANFIIF